MRWNEWSGESWYLDQRYISPQGSIQVIESVPKPASKKKAEKAEKLPFGFAREIPKKKKKAKS